MLCSGEAKLSWKNGSPIPTALPVSHSNCTVFPSFPDVAMRPEVIVHIHQYFSKKVGDQDSPTPESFSIAI